VAELKDALKAAYEADDYPILTGLEYYWEQIESTYDNACPDREDFQCEKTPLLLFCLYLSLGFFPPPEVLLAISICFEKYLEAGGDLSLDEVFFGKPHKKRTSFAAYHARNLGTYAMFHDLYAGGSNLTSRDLAGLSLAKRAEKYFDHMWGDSEWVDFIDIETFLRNYRRWKKRRSKRWQ